MKVTDMLINIGNDFKGVSSDRMIYSENHPSASIAQNGFVYLFIYFFSPPPRHLL